MQNNPDRKILGITSIASCDLRKFGTADPPTQAPGKIGRFFIMFGCASAWLVPISVNFLIPGIPIFILGLILILLVEPDIKRNMHKHEPDWYLDVLTPELRKEIKEFNKGLSARLYLDHLIKDDVPYDGDEAIQWDTYKSNLMSRAQQEIVAIKAKKDKSEAVKFLKQNRKLLKSLEKAANRMNLSDGNTRSTRDYASLVAAAVIKQKIS
jgi:hypothetical protein